MEIRIYTPMVLARSECLAVATVVNTGKLNSEPPLLELTRRLLLNNSLDHKGAGYGIYDYIRALTAIYGGIMLFYICGPVTPISRIYPKTGLDIFRVNYGYKRFSDGIILKAWSLMYKGAEEKGLQTISGPTIAPRGLYWTPGNTYEVLVTGVEY